MQARRRLRRTGAMAALLVMGAAAGAAPRTVRVDVTNGAPRLLVDGKPVRARMFFGGRGTSPIAVGPEGRQVSFEFTALAGAQAAGTLHLRFGAAPGDVFVDNVRITEAATGREVMPVRDFEQGEASFAANWYAWPPSERNTVGAAAVEPGVGDQRSAAVHVRLKSPPGGAWPDYHLYHTPNLTFTKGATYRVSLWCRAVPARELFVAAYLPGTTFTMLGSPPGRYASQIALAAGAGVDFVSFVIPTPWPAPGEPEDWEAVDSACEDVLRTNPKALLLPRFGLEPPAWWVEAHRDDTMQWEDGSRQPYGVPASLRYRHDAAARTRALVAHLEERFGDSVAGYHPCGHNTGEWFYQDTWGTLLNGYAPADLAGWRAWLAARYRSDEALRSAWRSPMAARSSDAVPSPAERRAAANGVLRDPGTERRLVDFALYQQDAMADLVRELARATREASGGRKLVVFFYGYAFEFGAVALGPATSGHYAMRRVLDSPDIDIVCSPISYSDRGLGETGPVMSAAESVPLAGKMWLQEDDTRTHESPAGPDAIARLETPEASVEVLTRNVVNEATRNMATWWMDLGMSGWFDNPVFWERMRALAPVDRPFVEKALPFRPQVAAVMDERSMHLVGAGAYEPAFPMTYGARHHLNRMGAPVGQYLLDDVEAGRVKARLYVMLNTWWTSAASRARTSRALRGAGRVWCYAPGAFEDSGFSPTAMRALTGFALKRVDGLEAWAEPTDAGRRLGLTRGMGLKKPVTPLFAVTDARPGEALMTYSDGSVAAALRRGAEGPSLFVGPPGLTPELLRVAARASAVHLYTQTDACVVANGPIVGVTAVQDGPVRLDLGAARRVTDALTGRPLGTARALTLPMRKGDTRVLRLDPPAPPQRSRPAARRGSTR